MMLKNLLQKTHPSFIKQFLSIFEFKKLKENKELFFVLLTMAVFIGFNVFFVHIGNYMLYNLGFDEGLAGLIQGGCLIISLLATIPAAILLNKGKNSIVVTIALISEFIGLWILYIFEGKKHAIINYWCYFSRNWLCVSYSNFNCMGKRIVP